MERKTNDKRVINDSEIEKCSKKPKFNKIDLMAQNPGESQSEEVSEGTMSSSWMFEEEDKREQAYYDAEILKMDRIAQNHVARIVEKQGKINHELVSEKLKRDWVTWVLNKPKVSSDIELQRLEEKKLQHVKRIDSLFKASMELRKAHDSILRVIEEQKKEKVDALKRIFQLESKHKLQLRIEEVKGKIEAMKVLGDDESATVQEELTEELKQKIGKLNQLEIMIETSIQSDARHKWQEKIHELSEKLEVMTQMKDSEHAALLLSRSTSRKKVEALENKLKEVNDELWEARRVTAGILMTFPRRSRTVIGIKRVGEIDRKPFVSDFMEKNLPKKIAEIAAERKCTFWEIMFSDQAWCPFKTIEDGGISKEVVNELDERLMNLRQESTQAVYNAVVIALQEIIEYNPIEKKVLDELWNFRDGRKAELAEAVDLIVRFINRKKVRNMYLYRLVRGPIP